jgi:DNA-binding transcriptional regulator of glucitol operon
VRVRVWTDWRLALRWLGIAGVCLLSLAGAVALAWWQWERYESASGSLQNLGYVLQWPLFGLFPAFVFWRMRKLRKQRDEETGQAPVARAPEPRPAPAETSDVDQTPEDAELAAYNRYLAELNARHQQETR